MGDSMKDLANALDQNRGIGRKLTKEEINTECVDCVAELMTAQSVLKTWIKYKSDEDSGRLQFFVMIEKSIAKSMTFLMEYGVIFPSHSNNVQEEEK